MPGFTSDASEGTHDTRKAQARDKANVSLVALVQEPFAMLVFTLVNSYASTYAYACVTIVKPKINYFA